jgi:stage III sporulation protein AF
MRYYLRKAVIMDALRSWIITLISVTILCTLVEKFAPQGSLNKYVRLVCGLAVTVIIAIPVLNFLNGDFKMEAMVWNEYMKLSEGELKRRTERLQAEDSRQMLELYRDSLIADIKDRFKAEGEFMVSEVDAVLFEDPNDETFGSIRALYLKLEPVSGNRLKTLGNETVMRIKKELSQVFALGEDKIYIDFSRFNGGN